jgi:tetratricopeptide (TPR) repeat protein
VKHRSFALFLAPLACWCAAGGDAIGAWDVHRSSASRIEQGITELHARPHDDTLAARLVRGLPSNQVDGLLGRFARRAREQPSDYAAQLAYAQLLLAVRHWPEAVTRFETAAQLLPEAVAPRWGRARALGRGGDTRAAVAELRVALGLARGSDQAFRLARELVTAAVATGDIDAEVDARAAWARARPGRRVNFDLAMAIGRAGRPGEAADILAGGIGTGRIGSERARWGLEEGRNRAAAGDLDRASVVLERARQELDREAAGRYVGAASMRPDWVAELRREIWTESIDIARRRGGLGDLKATLAHPRDAVEWTARARICDESGDLRGAWAAFDEAIRRTPRDRDLRFRRIAVALRIASVDQMVDLYLDLVRTAPATGDDLPALTLAALDGLWRLGRADVAGRLFDRLLESQRGGLPLLRVLAEVAVRWGDERRAELGWAAVWRRNPRDETALIAVGEAQFQRGQRRLAMDTWRALIRGAARRAEAHARLAEVLGDHGLEEPALVEARQAIAIAPDEPRHHRLLATTLERVRRPREAEGEWERVLRFASGPQRVLERREARTHLTALWVRQGSRRVDAELRELERRLGQDKGDRETLLFLVEAQLRTGRTDAALASLKAALSSGHHGAVLPADKNSRAAAKSDVNADLLERAAVRVHGDAEAESEADADLIGLLIRTLREAGRASEAIWWLEELSRRFPNHARDAYLQLVDLALAGHEDRRAQAFAARAAEAAPGDPGVVLRVAAVEERLGHFDRALAMYRQVVTAESDPVGTIALAALLARLGNSGEQRALLRRALRSSADEEVIVEAGRRAIVVEEAAGTLEALEAYLADTPGLNAPGPQGSARRRVLASILARVVPPAYRDQWRDPAAQAKLRRFALHGMRPLLDLVGVQDTEPDGRVVEILGMLGRPEAVPSLARLAAPELDPGTSGTDATGSTARAGTSSRDELISLAVIALGRLGGDGARTAIEGIARPARANMRLPLLWALGRVGGSLAAELARREIARGGTDTAILGCLTLGRAGDADAEPLLISMVADQARPAQVRRAAIFGLALGRHVAAIPALSGLLDAGDPDLASTARTALDLLARMNGDAENGQAIGDLPPDEAAVISGSNVEPKALLQALADQSQAAHPELNEPANRTSLPNSPRPPP